MTNPLLALSDRDLSELGRALRTGRLAAPFAAVAAQRFLSASAADEIATALQILSAQGFTADQLATLTEFIGQARNQRQIAEDLFDLVVTGPEAPGVSNRDTSVVVRELFAHANRCVVVAGYAVYQGQRVFQALADRMEACPELGVRFFLNIERGPGDQSASSQIVERFAERFRRQQWPKDRRLPEVYFDPRSLASDATKKASLHAKCVVTDEEHVFVSSANFTEAAHERNLEMGLLVHSSRLAGRLVDYFQTLVSNRLLDRLL